LSFADSARSDTLTGDVLGLVMDTQGSLLDDVMVTLTNQDNGQRNANFTRAGKYVIPRMRPGRYALSAQKMEFVTYNSPRDEPILLRFNYPEEVIPPIRLRAVPPSPIRPQAMITLISLRQPNQAQTPATTQQDNTPRTTSLVSLQDWALRSNFSATIVSALPL